MEVRRGGRASMELRSGSRSHVFVCFFWGGRVGGGGLGGGPHDFVCDMGPRCLFFTLFVEVEGSKRYGPPNRLGCTTLCFFGGVVHLVF